MAKGMWGLEDGSEVLADDATAAAQGLLRSRLLKAFSTTVLVIDSAQLYLVRDTEASMGCAEETLRTRDFSRTR